MRVANRDHSEPIRHLLIADGDVDAPCHLLSLDGNVEAPEMYRWCRGLIPHGRLLNNAFAFQRSFLPLTLEFQADGGKLLRPLGNAVDKGFEQNLRCKMKSFIYHGYFIVFCVSFSTYKYLHTHHTLTLHP